MLYVFISTNFINTKLKMLCFSYGIGGLYISLPYGGTKYTEEE